MKLSKEKMWRSAERALKRTPDYLENRDLRRKDNYEVMYVIARHKYPTEKDVVAVAGFDDVVISFRPLMNEDDIFASWRNEFDSHLFEYLGNGYELVEMSKECHCEVWYCIEDGYDHIENTKGMQKYLAYCKRNGVTKELLQEKVSYDGMDVMELYVKEVPEKQKREQER